MSRRPRKAPAALPRLTREADSLLKRMMEYSAEHVELAYRHYRERSKAARTSSGRIQRALESLPPSQRAALLQQLLQKEVDRQEPGAPEEPAQ